VISRTVIISRCQSCRFREGFGSARHSAHTMFVIPKSHLKGVNNDYNDYVGDSACCGILPLFRATPLSSSMAAVPLTHLRKLFSRMNYQKTSNPRTHIAVGGVSIMSRMAPANAGPVPLLGSMQISPVLGLPPASAGGRSGTLTLYYIKQNSRLLIACCPFLTLP